MGLGPATLMNTGLQAIDKNPQDEVTAQPPTRNPLPTGHFSPDDAANFP